MSDIRVYRERMRAAQAINKLLKVALSQGKSVKIARLVQEITLDYPVSEKYVKERITLYKESDPRVIEEDGELWERLDLAKE